MTNIPNIGHDTIVAFDPAAGRCPSFIPHHIPLGGLCGRQGMEDIVSSLGRSCPGPDGQSDQV